MRNWLVALAVGASLLLCFSPLWQISPAFPHCRAIALGDLDGDGDLDAFAANGRHEGVEPNRVWVNDGRGRFRDSGQRLGNNDSRSATLDDMDGDGDLDVLLCNAWSPPVCEVVENDGRGRLAFRQWLVEVDESGAWWPFGLWSAAAGDLDGDGSLDVWTVNCCGPPEAPAGWATTVIYPHNLVWRNDGGGNLVDDGQRLGTRDSHAVALGDVDGDGDLDAFVANGWGLAGDRANAVWLNDGRGQFADCSVDAGHRLSDSRTVALGDVDGDGDLDAFVGNLGPNEVWLNDGAGTFVGSGQRPGDGGIWVRLADLDGDDDLDAFVANGRDVQAWFNDGGGHFDLGRQTLYSLLFSHTPALGDVDEDGDLDLVAGRARQRPRVWLNDGTGRFVPRDRPWIWVASGAVVLSALGLWWVRRRRRQVRPPSMETELCDREPHPLER